MAVKIRLKRMGKKKQPTYRVVVADSRSPRDGRIIESIGRYDPRQDPSLIEIDGERALYWLQTGAQPTDRAKKLLEINGTWAKFRVAKGEVYTIPATAPAKVEESAPEAQEAADAATEVATEPEAATESEPVVDAEAPVESKAAVDVKDGEQSPEPADGEPAAATETDVEADQEDAK